MNSLISVYIDSISHVTCTFIYVYLVLTLSQVDLSDSHDVVKGTNGDVSCASCNNMSDRASSGFVSRESDVSEYAWDRLETYIQSICARCEYRGIDCKCHMGRQAPPFILIHSQAILQLRALSTLRDWEQSENEKWLVVHIKGTGIGNTLNDLCFALALAIITSRALIVDLAVNTFIPSHVSGFIRFSRSSLQFDEIISVKRLIIFALLLPVSP